jgi:hypothetical protein
MVSSAGPASLARSSSSRGKLEQCFVDHLMRYAVGRSLRPEEDGVVDSLSTSFKASDYSLTDLIVGYVASDRFALRQEDPVQ